MRTQAGGENTLVSEIAKARQHIKNSLERVSFKLQMINLCDNQSQKCDDYKFGAFVFFLCDTQMDGIAALASTPGKDVLERISKLELENSSLRDSKFLIPREYLMAIF